MYTVTQIIELINKGNIQAFYNERFWRSFSKQIIKEQHGECQYCKRRGKYTKATLVHHVKHLRIHPELAYSRYYEDEQRNKHRQLVALCHSCHEEQHERIKVKNSNLYRNEERW